MQNSKSENTPQLVLNPFSQRYVNIQPLFKYLNEKRRDSPAQVEERIEATIRFVSLFHDTAETDSMELKNTLGFLFEIKDVFSKLAEYKPE